MLEHQHKIPVPPKRTLVLGAGGFVGKTTVEHLRRHNYNVLGLARTELDLLASDASRKLERLLESDDSLVIAAAKAPCKNPAMLLENIRMLHTVVEALAAKKPAHVIYISSDAVYGDSMAPLNESSPAAPESLHGAMHLARELMLKAVVGDRLAILRPTLLYGLADPHSGYGPNQFRRLAERLVEGQLLEHRHHAAHRVEHAAAGQPVDDAARR